MPKIIVKQPFKFAHLGYQVEEFEASPEPRDTSDECAAVAVREGWCELAGKAHDGAPENADAARKREKKAASSKAS